jgi:hypothetical protein
MDKKGWFYAALNISMIGCLIFVHARLRQYAFDDAYIHFRAARNLIEVGVPYYNPAEALKVSTSSGWIVFLALIYWAAKAIGMEGDFSLFVSVINAVISICGAVIYTRIVELFLKRKAALHQRLLLQTIILALLLPSSIGLMETPLALFAAGVGIYFLLLSKPAGFALLAAAIYLRPELLALVVLICAAAVLQNKFKPRQIFGYFILGFFPMVLFDLYYFHTIVPHSIVAKSTVYSITPLGAFVGVLSKSLPEIPATALQNLFVKLPAFIVIVVILGWVALREPATSKMNFYPAALYVSGLLVIGMYVAGHAFVFDWYAPLYMLPISIAYFSYAYSIDHRGGAAVKLPLFLLGCLSAIFIITTTYSAFYMPGAFALFESGSRVKMYLAVGRALSEDYPGAKLLAPEIGALGYSFNGRIFDAAGLASADALLFHPMKVPEERSSGAFGAIPPAYVKFVDPDIIVSYDTFAEALLRDDVASRYNIIALPAYLPEDAVYSESKTIWGNKYLRVYIRKSLPVSDWICALSVAPCSHQIGR